MAVLVVSYVLVQPNLITSYLWSKSTSIRVKSGSLSPEAVIVAIGRAYQGVNDLEREVRDTEKGQKNMQM